MHIWLGWDWTHHSPRCPRKTAVQMLSLASCGVFSLASHLTCIKSLVLLWDKKFQQIDGSAYVFMCFNIFTVGHIHFFWCAYEDALTPTDSRVVQSIARRCQNNMKYCPSSNEWYPPSALHAKQISMKVRYFCCKGCVYFTCNSPFLWDVFGRETSIHVGYFA